MAIVPTVSVAPRLALAAQRRPWTAALALAAVLLKVRIVGLAVFTGVVAA
ncbi:MAG: hypothetical protein HY691_16955, partial [Chloroflexi bacterium]|nr:hypothetical protein [Chloroflexota bacterium]